jgi:hypothetical protein
MRHGIQTLIAGKMNHDTGKLGRTDDIVLAAIAVEIPYRP